MTTRVLIIDDDDRLNRLLTEYLGRFNFAVTTATHPEAGLRILKNEHPDILILDVMLPEMDGFAVCRKVRESSRIPIIMLTARGEVTDRIVGLELGADDYLSKPFEPRELVARIQSVLRRGDASSARSRDAFGDLVGDAEARAATLAGKALDLSTSEFDVLLLFVTNA